MGSGRNSTKNLYFAQILPAISFPENFDILLEEMLANSGKAYSAYGERSVGSWTKPTMSNDSPHLRLDSCSFVCHELFNRSSLSRLSSG